MSLEYVTLEALRDRFQQFIGFVLALPADFCEVEYNFQVLNRKTRERIALWAGAKRTVQQSFIIGGDSVARMRTDGGDVDAPSQVDPVIGRAGLPHVIFVNH